MRAQQIAEEARRAAEKYKDYHVALADGFKIFLPNIPQKMYHFTNYANAGEAEFRFNPDHPTSLLYEKQGDDYKLIGVMYTAPKHSTEEQLDERIPLSIAQWHEHVNFCSAPLAEGTNCWLRIRHSDCADRFTRKTRVTRRAELSVQWSLTGWSTSIPSKRIKRTYGPSSANTATPTRFVRGKF